jgi:hypothetical protein
LRLAWNAATAQCGGALTYAVYRSTTSGFTPGPANRIAACVGGTSFDDTTMPLDASVYYVVRAEDGGVAGSGPCNGGNADANLAQATGFASSTGGSATLYTNGFETGTGLADWVTGIFGGDDAVDWPIGAASRPALPTSARGSSGSATRAAPPTTPTTTSPSRSPMERTESSFHWVRRPCG